MTRWSDVVADGQRALAGRDYGKAEQLLLLALHEAERFAGDDWRVGVTLQTIGQVYRGEKKFPEAEKAFLRARDIILKVNGEESMELAHLNLDMAALFLDAGRPGEASAAARKTVAVYEGQLGGNDTQTGDALCMLGDALRAAKTLAEAETPLKRCLDIRQRDGGVDTPQFAEALHSLAMTYAGEAKYGLADPRFTLAEKIREKTLGLMSPVLAQTFEEHASVLKAMGRGREAERLLVLAGAIRRNEKMGKH